jgi:hypothetical protein
MSVSPILSCVSFSGDNRLSDLLFQAGPRRIIQPGFAGLRSESRVAANRAGRDQLRRNPQTCYCPVAREGVVRACTSSGPLPTTRKSIALSLSTFTALRLEANVTLRITRGKPGINPTAFLQRSHPKDPGRGRSRTTAADIVLQSTSRPTAASATTSTSYLPRRKVAAEPSEEHYRSRSLKFAPLEGVGVRTLGGQGCCERRGCHKLSSFSGTSTHCLPSNERTRHHTVWNAEE